MMVDLFQHIISVFLRTMGLELGSKRLLATQLNNRSKDKYMSQFTITLETVSSVDRQNHRSPLVQSEPWDDVIEAKDIDDAWEIAREKYYISLSASPDTQIVDIVGGVLQKQ